MDSNTIVIYSTIITGTLTVIAAYVGAITANWLNKISEQRNEANLERTIIKSLESELKTIFNLYDEYFVNDLENLNDGQMFLYKHTARQDFFSIFHSNGIFIGRIRNEELRNSIIKTYISLKKFLENLLTYTETFNRFDFEKEQMLRLLDILFKYPVNNQVLEEILSPTLSVKAALVNLKYPYENEDIILNLEKSKCHILKIKQELINNTKFLKNEFILLKQELLRCLNLINK